MKKTLQILLSTLVAIFSVQSACLAWTGPTLTPPFGNLPPPINLGSTEQTKPGGLVLNTAGLPVGLIVRYGKVGIGMSAPAETLDVAGNIRIGQNAKISSVNNTGAVADLITFNNDNFLRLGVSGGNGVIFGSNIASNIGAYANNTYSIGSDASRFAGIYGTNGYFGTGLGLGTISLDANYKLTTAGGGIKSESTTQPAGYFSSASSYALLTGTGNVGIGTVTPASKLEIYAPSATDGLRVYGSANQFAARFIGNSTSGQSYGVMITGNSTNAADYALHVVDSSINSLFDVKNNGNIGIGTANPGRALEVKNTDPVVKLNVTNGTIDKSVYEIRGIGAVGYEGLQFRTVNDAATVYGTLMTLSQGGNVGIGVAAPTAKLHIGGTAGVDGIKFPDGTLQTTAAGGGWSTATGKVYTTTLTDNVGIGTTAPAYSLAIRKDQNSATSIGINNQTNNTAARTQLLLEANGVTGVLLAAPSGYTEVPSWAGNTVIGGNTSLVINPYGANSYISFGTNGAVEKMRIDGAGNVGIGTTAPTANLSIYNANQPSISIDGPAGQFRDLYFKTDGSLRWLIRTDTVPESGSNAGSNLVIWSRSDTGAAIASPALMIQRSSGSIGVGLASPDTNYKLTTTAGGIKAENSSASQPAGYFNNGSTGPSIVTGTGNVGIGTPTPGYKLHVVGDVGISQPYAFKFANGQEIRDNGSGGLAITSGLSINNTVAGGGVYTISGGNVGIGTIAPDAKLKVDQTGAATDNYAVSGIAHGVGTTNYGVYANAWNGTGANYGIYSAGGTNYFSGNVGIKTTTPGAPLEVYADGAAADTSGGGIILSRLGSSNYRASSIFHRYITGTGDTMVFAVGAAGQNPYPAGTAAMTYAKMVITDAGRVGINTFTPSELLEVNGNVKATAFYYSSDKTLKNNIQPLSGSLNKILKLQGVSFDWKENNKPSVGLIAQDVEKVYPELVATNKGTGLKSVEYANLVAPLIESIKEQQKQIEELRAEISDLKLRIK